VFTLLIWWNLCIAGYPPNFGAVELTYFVELEIIRAFCKKYPKKLKIFVNCKNIYVKKCKKYLKCNDKYFLK